MNLTLDSVTALTSIKEKVTKKNKVVFVSGNFNIVHPGHLRLLRFATECGDFLVVGIHEDKISKETFIAEKLRLENFESISWPDFTFILRDPPEIFIKQLQPDVVVKGKEHEHQFNPEQEVVKQYGGKLLFGSGDISFSSLDLLQREFIEFNRSTIVKPDDFPQRHGFTLENLIATIAEFKTLKVCVLGDTIIDEYITCEPLGMSQEDPTIVVTPVLEQRFIGGAGIVASHAAGLGAEVKFFSIVGKDKTAMFAKEQLESNGVQVYLYEDDSRPTTLKQRFQAHSKTLLRVSHLRQHAISKDIQTKILSDFKSVLDNVQVVIFSDFNYGCLPQNLVDEIITQCTQKNIMMVADSQCSSQVGDVSRFKGMTLVTPTEREARLSVRDFESGLVVLAEALHCQAQSKHIIMTLDSEGLLVHANVSTTNQWHTDRLPAFNSAPKDLAGAGDSLLITAAMSLALGYNIWQAAYLGSIAAACQVGRLGNIPLTPNDLIKEIEI